MITGIAPSGGWARERIVLVATVAVVCSAAVVTVLVREAHTARPPFSLSAMHARVSITVAHAHQAQPILDRLAGRGRLQVAYVHPLATRQQDAHAAAAAVGRRSARLPAPSGL